MSEHDYTSACTDNDFPAWWEQFGKALDRNDRLNAEMRALAAFAAGRHAQKGSTPPPPLPDTDFRDGGRCPCGADVRYAPGISPYCTRTGHDGPCVAPPRPAGPVAPPPDDLEVLVEEFNDWWDLNREGAVNATYRRIDRFTKDARALLEVGEAPRGAARPPASPPALEALIRKWRSEGFDSAQYANELAAALAVPPEAPPP